MFGLPLYSFLHLLLNSPRLKNFKFHVTIYTLGLVVLLGMFFSLSEGDWLWSDFFHPFLWVSLTAFLWPLVGWGLSKNETHSYFWNFLAGLLKAFLAFFLCVGMFLWLNRFFSGFLNGNYLIPAWARNLFNTNNIIGLALQVVTPLVFPWYILGSLEKTLGTAGETQPEGIPFGRRITLGVLGLLAVGFPLEFWKVIQQLRSHQSIYFFDEKILLFLFALLSIGLAQGGKVNWPEKWPGIYPKVVSGLSILLVLISGFTFPFNLGRNDIAGVYYSLIYIVWFGLVFIYFFFRSQTGWVRPLLTLWVLLLLTMWGPLSPASLALRDNEKGLKNYLVQAGLLKDGLLVKAPPQQDPKHPLNQVGWRLQDLFRWDGLDWLKSSFPLELRKLDWDKEKGPDNLPKLMEWLGLPPMNAQANVNQYQLYSVQYNRRDRTKHFGSYQLLDFNANQGGGAPSNAPEFYLSLPKLGESLELYDNGKLAGVIPLNKVYTHLEKYERLHTQRNSVLPKDMELEYENEKIQVEINLTYLQLRDLEGKGVIQYCSGEMLVRRKGR